MTQEQPNHSQGLWGHLNFETTCRMARREVRPALGGASGGASGGAIEFRSHLRFQI